MSVILRIWVKERFARKLFNGILVAPYIQAAQILDGPCLEKSGVLLDLTMRGHDSTELTGVQPCDFAVRPGR